MRLDRLKFEHYLVAASVVALFAGTLLFGRKPPAPNQETEDLMAGHGSSVGRSGSSALASLLRSLGARVERQGQRLDLIPPGTNVILSIATPRASDGDQAALVARERSSLSVFDEDEIRGLAKWMKNGGTFVWLPRPGRGEGLLRELGLEWVKTGAAEAVVRRSIDLSRVRDDLNIAYAVDVGSTMRLKRTASTAREPVALGEDGAGWIAALVPVGRGRAVVFCDPHLARNDALTAADHDAALAHLALGSAGNGAIAFDEYHHELGGGSLLGYLAQNPSGAVLLHVLAIGLLAVLGTGRRLGPATVSHEEERRRPLEFVEAFGRLCRVTGNSGLAVDLALQNTVESLHRRFGGADDASLERESARRGVPAGEAVGILKEARRLSGIRPAPGEMLESIRRLESLRRVLTDQKKG